MEAYLALLQQLRAVISQGQCVIQVDLHDSHLGIVSSLLITGVTIRENINLVISGQDPYLPSPAFVVNFNLDFA